MVMDKAQVLDFARISGNAAIFGDAQVEGYAHISGTMEIGDHAKVSAKRPRRWVTPESLPLDILLQFPQRREKGADKLRGSLLTIGPV